MTIRNLLLTLALTMAGALSAGAVKGDVNNDGEVNISDVNAVIDIILNSAPGTSGDVNGDGEVNISDVNVLIDIILNGGSDDDITPKEIALDYTTLTEPSESIPDDEDADDYGDYVENTIWVTNVYIAFNGESVTVTGAPSTVGVATSGAHVTVTNAAKRVKFIVSGSSTNGSLKFYSERKFQVCLNGLDLTNPTGAAINNQCGKSFYLVLNEGTVNTLRDGETYTMVDGEDQKAALFSEGQILVSGKGTLNIYSVGKHAMASDDYVLVRPGTSMYLNSTGGHGIKAKDFVYIKGGVINMEIAAAGAKGINCDSLIYITGGRTTIINSGATRIEQDDSGNAVTTTCAGVKSDYNLTMTGGTLNVKCTGDDAKGINVAQPFLFSGGELNVVCAGSQANVAPKGVKCDSNLTISGGSFYSCVPNGRAADVDGTLTIATGYATLSNDDNRLLEVTY